MTGREASLFLSLCHECFNYARGRCLDWFLISLLLLLSIGFSAPASSQSSPGHQAPSFSGTPLTISHRPEDLFGHSFFATFAQPEQGKMLIGTNEGLLVYSGADWKEVPLPNRGSVSALTKAGNHDYWLVGSRDYLASVSKNTAGEWIFEDLTSQIPFEKEQDRSFGQIWDILPESSGAYIRTDKWLVWYPYEPSIKNSVKIWPLPPESRGLFLLNDRLFGRLVGTGLVEWLNGVATPVEGGEVFGASPAYRMLSTDSPNKGLMVAELGMYYLEIKEDGGASLTPSGVFGEDWIQGEAAYSVAGLDGNVLIGTLEGTFWIMRPDGHVLARWPMKGGAILEIFIDEERGLWLGMESELHRIALSHPWSIYPSEMGLGGSIFDVDYWDGYLFAASARGLLKGELIGGQAFFQEWFPTNLEAASIDVTKEGMLLVDRSDLWLIPDSKTTVGAKKITELDGGYEIIRSKYWKDTWFVMGEVEVLIIKHVNGAWTIDRRIPWEGLRPLGFIEKSAQEWWMGDARGGVWRWAWDSTLHQERRQQFAIPSRDKHADVANKIIGVKDRIYAANRSDLYLWDERDQTFNQVPNGTWPFPWVKRPLDIDLIEVNQVGTLAYTKKDMWIQLHGNNEWQKQGFPSPRFASFQKGVLNADGQVRVLSWGGILQWHPDRQSQENGIQKSVGIASMSIRPERLSKDEKNNAGKNEEGITLLPTSTRKVEVYPGETLNVNFEIPQMDKGAELRWRFIGMDDSWTEWSTIEDASIVFKNRGAANYTMQVEGRTIDGAVVKPLTLEIISLPEWWQKPSVKAFFALILLGIGIGAINVWSKLQVKRLREKNEELEGRVKERTKALETANKKLAEWSIQDGLTGVSNRRAFDFGFAEAWRSCEQTQTPISLLLIDVDFFKQFNDAHGHQAGDERLIGTADLLKMHVEDPHVEVLARYGGEEFVLVLPNATSEQAMRRAEEIRAGYEAKFKPGLPGSVSIGVATVIPTSEIEHKTLITMADHALYEAKKTGRNRVVLHKNQD